MQPQVALEQDYQPGKDVQVNVRLEALPDVPAANIEGLKLERLTVALDEAAVDEQIKRLASANKSWTDAKKGHAAANGDAVVIDFAGSVDGTPFDGGTGTDMQVELGSGQLIPGFEDQLVGAKAGDKRDVQVTFPEDYPVENLKGKAGNVRRDRQGREEAGERRRMTISPSSWVSRTSSSFRGILRDQPSRSSTVSPGRI